MKYFMDCEFIEDGRTIDLISIGIVCEDGREYYAQSIEFDHRKASKWVQENVLLQLPMCPHAEPAKKGISGLYRTDRAYHKKYGPCVDQQGYNLAECPWCYRVQIASEISAFCNPDRYGEPEFWTYYGSYDHVVLCQLYGTMMNLPLGWPMHTMDIKQFAVLLGDPLLPRQESGEHNALQDARHNQVMWKFLDGISVLGGR